MKLTGSESINAITFKVQKSNVVIGSINMNMYVDEYMNKLPSMAKRQIMSSDWTYVKEVKSGDYTLIMYSTPIVGGKNSIVLIKE